MPEAPDLEVIRDFLAPRLLGEKVTAARVIKPSVIRPLAGDFAADLAGRSFQSLRRKGKMLLFGLSGDRTIALHMMLTGLLQYAEPTDRLLKKTCFVLSLSSGKQLRYLDEKQMGMAYYATGGQLTSIPRLVEDVPDVLEELSLAELKDRLRPFRCEIKGILTRGQMVAGIGNAYAAEILFGAKIYPFRKKNALSDADLDRLRTSMPGVIKKATEVVRERAGDQIHKKIRDFLRVHRRGGESCPVYGGTITEVTANRRITSYCRTCQPGMLIRN
jgi:formamidopyrimidine-DNA glycosylase